MNNSKYLRWQIGIIFVICFGYLSYLILGNSVSFTTPYFRMDSGLGVSKLGILMIIMVFASAISTIFHSILLDSCRLNSRYLFSIGLFVAGIAISLFGWTTNFIVLIILWSAYGWFIGIAKPVCIHLIANWYSTRRRGSIWGIWQVSTFMGIIASPLVLSIFPESYGWRFSLLAGGIIAFFVSIIIVSFLKDSPEAAGLPPIEVEDKTFREAFIQNLIKNRLFWAICFASLFLFGGISVIKEWSFKYFLQMDEMSMTGYGFILSFSSISGIAGGLCAGLLSDFLFKTRRGVVAVLFVLLMTTIFAVSSILPAGAFFTAAGFAAARFFSFGAFMLASVMAVDIASKRAAATAVMIVTGFGAAGAKLSKHAGGYIFNQFEWTGLFYLVISSILISTLFFLFTWHFKADK